MERNEPATRQVLWYLAGIPERPPRSATGQFQGRVCSLRMSPVPTGPGPELPLRGPGGPQSITAGQMTTSGTLQVLSNVA